MRYSVLAVSALLVVASPAAIAVYKCQDSAGKATFSDLPCPSSQVSSTLTVQPASGNAAPPQATRPALGSEALAREQDRAESAQRRQQTQAVIDRSNQRIRQIREENQDPARCRAARTRMQQLEKRDGPSVKHTLDYFEYQQMASLYCGNR